MKEKRLTAMFVSSMVAFVASLAISLGVVFALADPVAAVGLHEYTYKISSSTVQTEVFDPVGYFNEKIDDVNQGIIVNGYDDILYANEGVVDDIKLVKTKVVNDTETDCRFTFDITVSGETNAKKYAEVAVINALTGKVYYIYSGKTEEITIAHGTSINFVVAAYVSDYNATEKIDLSQYMSLEIGISKIVVGA